MSDDILDVNNLRDVAANPVAGRRFTALPPAPSIEYGVVQLFDNRAIPKRTDWIAKFEVYVAAPTNGEDPATYFAEFTAVIDHRKACTRHRRDGKLTEDQAEDFRRVSYQIDRTDLIAFISTNGEGKAIDPEQFAVLSGAGTATPLITVYDLDGVVENTFATWLQAGDLNADGSRRQSRSSRQVSIFDPRGRYAEFKRMKRKAAEVKAATATQLEIDRASVDQLMGEWFAKLLQSLDAIIAKQWDAMDDKDKVIATQNTRLDLQASRMETLAAENTAILARLAALEAGQAIAQAVFPEIVSARPSAPPADLETIPRPVVRPTKPIITMAANDFPDLRDRELSEAERAEVIRENKRREIMARYQ